LKANNIKILNNNKDQFYDPYSEQGNPNSALIKKDPPVGGYLNA